MGGGLRGKKKKTRGRAQYGMKGEDTSSQWGKGGRGRERELQNDWEGGDT